MSNRQRLRFALIFASILIFSVCTYISASEKGIDNSDRLTEKFLEYIQQGECNIPEQGFVPDAETAAKIAEAVWLPIFGKDIYDEKPFNAKLVNDSLWFVYCSFKHDISTEGGVAYAAIRKTDGRVICVMHDQ